MINFTSVVSFWAFFLLGSESRVILTMILVTSRMEGIPYTAIAFEEYPSAWSLNEKCVTTLSGNWE